MYLKFKTRHKGNNMNLYKISTKKTSAWGRVTPKPLYVISEDKDRAVKYAQDKLIDGIAVKSVSYLGSCVSGVMFIPETKSSK